MNDENNPPTVSTAKVSCLTTNATDAVMNSILGNGWEDIIIPRRIVPPNGYPSPKMWWAQWAMKISYPTLVGRSFAQYDSPERKRDTDMFSYTEQKLRATDGPTFFLSNELIDALDRTDVENAMPMEELRFPHEAMLFVLPTSRRFAEINGVFGSNSYITMFTISQMDHVKYGKSYIVTFLDCEGVTSHAHYPCQGTYESQMSEFGKDFYCSTNDAFEAFKREFGVEVSPSQLEADKWQNGMVVRMAWKILCAMNCTNDIVRVGGGVCREARTKKGKTRPALWNPIILDLGERIHTEGEDSSGAGVRLHWRRGHFRRQVCGVGRSQRKTMWIKPHKVGSL